MNHKLLYYFVVFESIPGQHSKIEKIKLFPTLPKWPFPFFRKSAKLRLPVRLAMLPLERMESEFDHNDWHQPTWYSRFYRSWFFVVHQSLVEGIFCIAKHKAFWVFNKSFNLKLLKTNQSEGEIENEPITSRDWKLAWVLKLWPSVIFQ